MTAGMTAPLTRLHRKPIAARPASFVSYLSAAANRRRKINDTGVRYEIVLAVLWFAPSIAFGIWSGLTQAPPAVPAMKVLSAGALLLAGMGAIGLLCSLFGPVTASREWRSWLLSTPLDRGLLLRRRVLAVLAAVTVPGLFVGALAADGAGIRGGGAIAIVMLGPSLAVMAGSLAIRQQCRIAVHRRGHSWSWLAAIVLLVGAAAALGVTHLAAPSAAALWTIAELALVIAAGFANLAVRSAGWIPLPALSAGVGSVGSMAMAIQEQSLAPMVGVFGGAQVLRALSRPLPLTGVGLDVLRRVDLRRTGRNRSAQIRFALMVVIPYLALALTHGIGWGGSALGVITALCATAAISALCTTLRQFSQTEHLADAYGLDRAGAKKAATSVPTWGAGIWAVLCTPALILDGEPELGVLIALGALVLVLYRAKLAPFEPGFAMGNRYSRDMRRRALRGPAQLLLLCVVAGVIAAFHR